MKKIFPLIAFVFSVTFSLAHAADDFRIHIERTLLSGKLLTGTIYLNGVAIGNAYENDDVKIAPGTYKGLMRYSSARNFVQGPGGVMGQEGDFLLEVSGVTGFAGESRTAILLHGGNEPHQSQGCILLGPIGRNPVGQAQITKEHPLYKLRVAFYGTDTPDATPNKNITIEIHDHLPRIEGTWQWNPRDQRVTIKADGTCTSSYNNSGTWTLVDAKRRLYRIQWKRGGFIDTLTLSENGNALAGHNQFEKNDVTMSRIR